uniref:DUF4116 domain-containing protein n=1 Tax=Pinguiococcus pyrenoidosus TaxID=172671 RepID=A0A7R9YFP0_9STRA|mmetsp:Transcript_8745/g.32976  ORF Transcript_8745/g.32976 Transcript_8745/m.32976 type:complete len:572 (+) Transcript_8745:58-1773(+)
MGNVVSTSMGFFWRFIQSTCGGPPRDTPAIQAEPKSSYLQAARKAEDAHAETKTGGYGATAASSPLKDTPAPSEPDSASKAEAPAELASVGAHEAKAAAEAPAAPAVPVDPVPQVGAPEEPTIGAAAAQASEQVAEQVQDLVGGVAQAAKLPSEVDLLTPDVPNASAAEEEETTPEAPKEAAEPETSLLSESVAPLGSVVTTVTEAVKEATGAAPEEGDKDKSDPFASVEAAQGAALSAAEGAAEAAAREGNTMYSAVEDNLGFRPSDEGKTTVPGAEQLKAAQGAALSAAEGAAEAAAREGNTMYSAVEDNLGFRPSDESKTTVPGAEQLKAAEASVTEVVEAAKESLEAAVPDAVAPLVDGINGEAAAEEPPPAPKSGPVAEALAQVQSNGMSLENLPEYNDDKDICKQAVLNNGLALQFVGENLKADREIVLSAVQQDGNAIQFMSPALKDDKEIALTAVSSSGQALRYAPQFSEDKEVALAAVEQSTGALDHVANSLTTKKTFWLEAITRNAEAAGSLPSPLRRKTNKKFVVDAVQKNSQALQYLPKTLKEDPDVISAAMGGSPDES